MAGEHAESRWGQLGFDLRTQGTFSSAPAAIPEPATLAMTAPVILAVAALALRRRRAPGR